MHVQAASPEKAHKYARQNGTAGKQWRHIRQPIERQTAQAQQCGPLLLSLVGQSGGNAASPGRHGARHQQVLQRRPLLLVVLRLRRCAPAATPRSASHRRNCGGCLTCCRDLAFDCIDVLTHTQR